VQHDPWPENRRDPAAIARVNVATHPTQGG
jgi:hypothetical protein